MNRFKLSAAALVLLATQALASSAAPIAPDKSTLVAQFSQFNVPVEASFTKFRGTVTYDASTPANSKASLEIDMNSLDLGDDAYSAEVRKKEWFDSARFPVATFEASTLRPLGGTAYEAAGTLRLKGKAQEIKVRVTLTSAQGASAFDGSVPISRRYFDIGDAAWGDAVADQVVVKFHIVVPGNR